MALPAFGGIGEAFGDANFRRYTVGSVVSWLTFFIQAVAIAWVTWTLTHSTKWLSAVALLDAVPMSALAPFGGVVADRFDRFRVLMAAYAFATAHAAVLTGLAFTGHLTIGYLAALALIHGAIHAFSVPAAFGLLPRFVAPARLPSAIAVSAAYTQLGIFVGPAIAGWIILHFGPAAAFGSNVAGYGVFFVSAARMRTPAHFRPTPPSERAFAYDLAEGLRAIRGHAGVSGILTLMLFGDALAAAVRQMLPALSDRALNSGIEGLSTLLAGAGIGATLSALWLAHGGRRRLRMSVILTSYLAYLAATAALLSVVTLSLATIAMVVRGFCFEICRAGAVGLLQTTVPDRLRGRIMSAQFFLQQGASAVGVALIGGVADRWGLRAPLLCGCAAALLVWLVLFRRRSRMNDAFAESGDYRAAARPKGARGDPPSSSRTPLR
jgi:predicted MFS family arabinose efflux permease